MAEFVYTWQHVFDGMRLRPILYTGEVTLSSVHQFLGGYAMAADVYSVDDPDDRLLFPNVEFCDWVRYRLHCDASGLGWCRSIYSKTESEEEAIECFFRLLEEFYERQPHPVARLTGFEKSYKRSVTQMENGQFVQGPMETLHYPESILLVTYTDDPGFFADSETDVDLPHAGFFHTIEWFESWIGAKREMLTIIDPDWNPDDC